MNWRRKRPSPSRQTCADLRASVPTAIRSPTIFPRTCGDRAADSVCVLRRPPAAQAREDVTRTLESQPRQWKVVETVREKFTCRDCEKVTQAPGALPCDREGMGGAEPAGDDRVSRSSASTSFEPSGRAPTPWKACRSRCRPWRTPWDRSARRSRRSFAWWRPM